MSIDLAAMGSPALLDAAGVAEPRDLLRLPLLGDHGGEWLAWFEAAGVAVGALPPLKAQYPSQQMAATAAIAGQGLALLTPDFFRSEIRAGALVEPFGVRLKATEDYYLVYLESRAGEPKIRAFCDWLVAELAIHD